MPKRPAQPAISASADATLAAYRQYLDAEEDVDATTRRCYLSDLRQFASWCEATWMDGQEHPSAFVPTAVAAPLIKEYRSHLQTVVKLRPATINRQLISLKRYFAWALATQQITRDPSRAVKAIPQEVLPPRHLTDQEEHALVAAVEQHGTERDRVIVLLLLHTGLRAEELCGLRREQVTLGRRSGHLAIYGKRNKYREVPLNSTARQVLEPYLAHLPPTVPYLFPSNKGRVGNAVVSAPQPDGTPQGNRTDAGNGAARRQPAPIGTRALNYLVMKYAALAKLADLSPHDLRHRFGYVLAQTVPLHRLAQIMGHDSLDTTAIYIRGTPQDLQQAVEQRAWT